MNVFQEQFKIFRAAQAGRLHFAAHSHHYWTDAAVEAHRESLDLAINKVDDKWDEIFGSVLPETQALLAEVLKLQVPAQIAFAPNTHELFYRVVSSLPGFYGSASRPLRILTTSGEFHSVQRQLKSWEALGVAQVTRVPVLPLAEGHCTSRGPSGASADRVGRFERDALAESSVQGSFETRMKAALTEGEFDLVVVSHVFFQSGRALDLAQIEQWASLTPPSTLWMVDGYHGFFALPTALGSLADRIFYMAGGYKYAGAGEGACFLTIPKNFSMRPAHTGWFADASGLEHGNSPLAYAPGGMAFQGSTLDFTALFRLRASLRLWKRLGITVEALHQQVVVLQRRLIEQLRERAAGDLYPTLDQLVDPAEDPLSGRGHFLAFDLGTEDEAKRRRHLLAARKVQTDCRGSVIRFGIGVYLDPDFALPT